MSQPKKGIVFDPDAPEFDPLRSQPACRPMLTNKKQNATRQDFRNLHLIPQCSHGREEIVITRYGYDMRQHFPDTIKYPWSAQVFLRIKFPSHGDFTYGQGSGTFIGPNVILTAAHNVRNMENRTQEEYKNIEITPGAYQDKAPFKTPSVKHVLIPHGYNVNNPNYRDHDFALIIIGQPTGNYTGWLGVTSLTDEELRGREVNIVGYPADKGQSQDRQLWGAGDTIKKVEPERFTYWIDTAKGQSGSGVWIWSDQQKEPYIVGVHVFGPDTVNTPRDEWENEATRLTDAKFQQIVNWMCDYAYRDPLYKSVEEWIEDFCDKKEKTLLEAQIQIAPLLWKQASFSETTASKLLIGYLLRTGRFPVFVSMHVLLEHSQELDLAKCGVGCLGARVLAENKTLRLRVLRLSQNQIGDEGVRYLAQNRTWPLEELDLSNNRIGKEGAKALAENKTWQLKTLYLSHNQIGDGGVISLVGNKTWLLRTLHLSGNQVGTETAHLIAERNKHKVLRIEIDHQISHEGAKDKTDNNHLRSEDVSHQLQQCYEKTKDNIEVEEQTLQHFYSRYKDRKGIVMCSLILPEKVTQLWEDTTLRELDFWNSSISTEQAKLLARNRTWPLQNLNLSRNRIGDEGTKALAENTTWPLRILYLSYNHISNEGAKALAENATWPLEELDLSNNEIGDEGANAIAENNTWPLGDLYLGWNQISDDGAKALAQNTTWILKRLSLYENPIKPKTFLLFDSEAVSVLKKRFGEYVVEFELDLFKLIYRSVTK